MSSADCPADGGEFSAERVIKRLEEAGRTLLALPMSGYSTRMVSGGLEWVRDAAEAYGFGKVKLRPGVPSAAAITRMDRTYRWMGLIPDDRYVLRRVLGARSLIDPLTGRYLYSWRRLGVSLGADHKAVQRWHCQGVDLLVERLNQRMAA